MSERYEAVIGLEVHVELATKNKIFCDCSTRFGASPNTQVCPVCMGLPGALPVLNERAVDLAIAAGLATNCSIANVTRLDRKNYFYPDLPKAYQISQAELPLCSNGWLDISVGGESKRIRITRIHIEEDAGKLIHDKDIGTLIDYNRCGVPLIEIVTEPDIRTSEEARAFLTELRSVLMYTGISDCKMNEGSFRCDVNLSVRRMEDSSLGVRTEMKNINSFSFAAKAIEFEYARQAAVLEAGGEVTAETRRFDSKTGETYAMRSKESASDYRFFPEPDLPAFRISKERVNGIASTLPVFPAERRQMYAKKYGVSATDAEVIASRKELADYFEEAAENTQYPRIAANILLTELLASVSADGFQPRISAIYLAELASLYGEQTVNSSTVKKMIQMLPEAQMSPRELVRERGLGQINDIETLTRALEKVIAENPKLMEDYKNGKLAAKKAVIGRVMAATGGKANPKVLDDIWKDL